MAGNLIDGKIKKFETTGVSYHVALFIYPWKNAYPVEDRDNTEASDNPIVLSSDLSTGTGITFLQYTRRREPGSALTIDCMGKIDPVAARIGNWCVLTTSSKSPIKKTGNRQKPLNENSIVQFIGQIYNVNCQYLSDGNGNFRRIMKITLREWSHILHVPVRLHPAAMNKAQSGQVEETVKKAGTTFKLFGTALLNVFESALVGLQMLGGISKDNTSIVDPVINSKDEYLKFLRSTVSRFPVLPKLLMEDLFGSASGDPEDFWTDNFMKVASGVQKWGDISVDNNIIPISNLDNLKSFIKADAQRPLAFVPISDYIKGGTLLDIIAGTVGGNAASEFFADLWYTKKDDGTIGVQPVIVVRDTPFSFKGSGLGSSFLSSDNFEWTFFDDIPRTKIPAGTILAISVSQTSANTANFIQLSPANNTFASAAAADLTYNSTVVLPESQKRFGGQSRQMQVRDIWTLGNKQSSLLSPSLPTTPVSSDSETIKAVESTKDAKSLEAKGVINFSWFQNLIGKLVEWYASDYMFPSVTLTIKDNNTPISIGHNIEFQFGDDGFKYVAHVTGIDVRLQVHPDGRIENITVINAIRLCHDDKGCKVVPQSVILNLLGISVDLTTQDTTDEPLDSKLTQSDYVINTTSTVIAAKETTLAIANKQKAGVATATESLKDTYKSTISLLKDSGNDDAASLLQKKLDALPSQGLL